MTPMMSRASQRAAMQVRISGPGAAVLVLSVLMGAILTAATTQPWGVLGGIVVGIYFLFAIKVVKQWEKVAVLRFGRYLGLRGPGVASSSCRLSIR